MRCSIRTIWSTIHNISLTENTRGAYPIQFIQNA
jgi:hypothetical protein